MLINKSPYAHNLKKICQTGKKTPLQTQQKSSLNNNSESSFLRQNFNKYLVNFTGLASHDEKMIGKLTEDQLVQIHQAANRIKNKDSEEILACTYNREIWFKNLGKIGTTTEASTNYQKNIIDKLASDREDNYRLPVAELGAILPVGSNNAHQQAIFNALTNSTDPAGNSLSDKALRRLTDKPFSDDGTFSPAVQEIFDGINSNEPSVQISSLKDLKNIALKVGYMTTRENLKDQNGDELKTKAGDTIPKTILTKVLEDVKSLRESTDSPEVFTEAIIAQKELEAKDANLKIIKGLSVALQDFKNLEEADLTKLPDDATSLEGDGLLTIDDCKKILKHASSYKK